MRAWLVAIALVLAASMVRAQAPAMLATTATGFDHNLHDRDIAVSGGTAIACSACHGQRNGLLVGRPDHASCFGACHGAVPVKPKQGGTIAVAAEQRRICVNCHAETALAAPLAKTVPVPYPPYIATDFALSMPHQRHKQVPCAACHFLPGKAAPHRRCVGCHDGSGNSGKGPAMSQCIGCHTPGSGSPQPPRMAAPIDTVIAAYSHPKHAARGGAGALCATCHAEILATDDSILPRPKQTSCAIAGCHDGKPAFAVTEACTRCHTGPPPWKFEVERPTERFSHATTHKDVKLPCAACHPLGATGEVLVAGHAACVPCHEARFGERRIPKARAGKPIDPNEPKQICGACHNATEPWRKLTADRPPPERTEFGATLTHDKHSANCGSCHSLASAASQLRPPRGHKSCTGSGCHAVKGGPAPELTACESCHQLGLAAKRVALRTTLPWSVRKTFDHAVHRVGPNGPNGSPGAEVACTRCHDDLHGASITQLAAPPKLSCQPCHDGGTAFKLTGTTCTRCHPGATSRPAL
ncbi:MAG: hypothetical protein IPQ07_26105 [Myxococcales bacterium]|nr:hypothetical protein [Myxococcales bacterium]